MTFIGLVVALLWVGIAIDLWQQHATAIQPAKPDAMIPAQAFDAAITGEATDLARSLRNGFSVERSGSDDGNDFRTPVRQKSLRSNIAERAFFDRDYHERMDCLVGVLLTATIVTVGLIMSRQRRLLIASRQALAVTLKHMSQGIAVVDATDNIRVLNQRAVDLLGLPPELVAATPTFRQICDWQSRQREFGDEATWDPKFRAALLATGGPRSQYSYERSRPSGSTLEVRTEDLPDGGFVRTYTDITEGKRNEAALAAAHARAAHGERLQVLGQLAGGIAHDFNNILQAVQGGASLIDKRASDPESVRQFAQMILDATERGTSITGRLLAFARRGELRAEPVDPAALLDGLRLVLSHTLGSPIAVEVSADPDRLLLLADKGQLETVLINLATNARDAMPNGGTLRFSCCAEVISPAMATSRRLGPGHYIRLSISDTGYGMDHATLAAATEPFFSTKPPGRGTGLGLSMAKRFLEQSGGALAIDSDPGRGTTVHLWLPATTPPPPARAQSRPIERGKRILLVDDEAMVRETLAAELEDAGYLVLLAASGPEALELLASPSAVDVLVTDLAMPVLDGLALIREARRVRPSLPSVLLTGHTGLGGQLATDSVVDDSFRLVRKPVTAAGLSSQIEALWVVPIAG